MTTEPVKPVVYQTRDKSQRGVWVGISPQQYQSISMDRFTCWEARALISLASHEAAMTEERELRFAVEKSWHDELALRSTLQTRLSALAGELSENVTYADHMQGAWIAGANHARQDAAKRIRTLASTATDGEIE